MNKEQSQEKIRLDQLLVQNGFAATRDDAQRIIRSGNVYINDCKSDKPGVKVNTDSNLRVTEKSCPYASRGGLKLEKALQHFSLDVSGFIAADFGASNGGFTDCLLQKGAQKVYAVDVGHGQLDYRLQQDDRVVVMDKTNCRYLTAATFGSTVDILTADLSFISLKTVFNAVNQVVKENGHAVFLIKPQFEAGKNKVSKGGIVKKHNIHLEVITEIIHFIESHHWSVNGLTYSPVTGKSGNIEFLIWIQKKPGGQPFTQEQIVQTVEEAHQCHTIQS